MKSVGIDLAKHVRSGKLWFHAARPTYHGLEMHLLEIYDLIREFKPTAAVFDPLTNLDQVGNDREVKAMLMRLIDFLKTQKVTAIFTTLTSGGSTLDQSEVGVSSLMDAWIILRNLESGGERNRALYLLKARGLAHSNQVREFVISNRGLDLVDVYTGGGEVLAGSARVAREAQDTQEARDAKERVNLRRLTLARERLNIRGADHRAESGFDRKGSRSRDRVIRGMRT